MACAEFPGGATSTAEGFDVCWGKVGKDMASPVKAALDTRAREDDHRAGASTLHARGCWQTQVTGRHRHTFSLASQLNAQPWKQWVAPDCS